ncbi:hypothetical protein MUY14_01490 [Amycolatopsis sp. FBCC-B4732]|uniref:8-oxoguanine DNA glycosylase OGG fold protein n=1 Tax=Amycolatopsis sp. FBCC-B4732 TaxID=3079339 RepID=UPI001FF5238C|nr:hypothetical protein [Amycolatopsis sp. FBCC-B4732]UOX89345.1 hypothetical protein MUY14_01490 [Amycolatopsis sp. FBCC-B4732]
MPHVALPGEPEAILVDPQRWAARLPPGAWPEDFALDGEVRRADVFALADRWRALDVPALQFTAGVLAWGHGIRGYGPHRTSRVLEQPGAAERLEAALAGLRADVTPDVLLDSYERFGTTAKVRGLGAAFFTKLLYFAGYRRGEGGVQPLILDRVVARRLPEEAGPAWKYTTAWWSSTWSDYLRWAAEQARRPEYGNEPDRVEMALFTGAWTA